MASSKKPPTYKVETRLAIERKRRKSDLVIMWQSIWSVTVIIVKELRTTLLRMWELIEMWFSSSERFLVQSWLEKHLPYVPEDFSESWRDGRLMAILLNKLRAGCFPDANRLDPDYGLKNVYRVFDILELYFGIKPDVSVEEIITCTDGSNAKLFDILLQLKKITESQSENQNEPEPIPKENLESSGITESCIAKGTGLAIGFVGKFSSFMVFCELMSDLDVVVEIKGPDSICSERITKRSPKRKRSVPSWEYARTLTRSISCKESGKELVTLEDEDLSNKIIPLEYEIIGNQISLSYKPKEKGKHKITILWHGQHVSDSPYFVTVEDPFDINGISKVVHLKSALKTSNDCGTSTETSTDKPRKISVRFQESNPVICKEQKKQRGKILSRRVLRYIVRVQGKDIAVNAENTESLATELLKMDYDFEKCPSFHRRNSWGFTGDAERKKSVIRQFCVDVNELDAQISQRRSRSLSINPSCAKLSQKSDSFECLMPNLNIVNEDVFEISEKAQGDEKDYAYIDEVDETNQMTEIMCYCVPEIYSPTDIEEETSRLSSELTQSEFVESSQVETSKISSLSTNVSLMERVDNSKEDLKTNALPCSSALEHSNSNAKEFCDISGNNHHLNLKFQTHQNQKYEQQDCKASKTPHLFSHYETMRKGSKMRNCATNRCYHSLMYKTKRESLKFPLQNFYTKTFKIRNLSSVSALNIPINNKKYERRMLKTGPQMPSEILQNIQFSNISKTINPVEHKTETSEFFTDTSNISHITQEVTNDEKNTPLINGQCPKGSRQINLKDVNHALSDAILAKNISKQLNNEIHKVNPVKLDSNLELNHNISAMPLTNSKTKAKPTHKPIEQFFINHNLSEFPARSQESSEIDAGGGQKKPLRTHTLKTIEHFSFKQFQPSLPHQNSITPVKLQIGHWESAISSRKLEDHSQKAPTPDPEVSVKEKLAFWENAYKTDETISQRKAFVKNYRKTESMDSEKSCTSSEGNSDVMQDFHVVRDTDNTPITPSKSRTPAAIPKEEEEEATKTCNFINQDANETTKLRTNDKLSSELQMSPHKINRRSFSDPVMLGTTSSPVTDGPSDIPVNISCIEPQVDRVHSNSSSTVDNLDPEYDDSDGGDSSEDSGGDYVLQSTEDEYIDDEISERASEYWGDLSIVKDWTVAAPSVDEYSFWGEEFLQNWQRNKSYPEECKVFGIAVYYGHVAVKNRFQVYTGDAGFGNLSVSMQSTRQHDVSFVSVAYIRNELYEVTYQVMTAGYYLISIRWMDKVILGSPFVCKVTF